MSRSDYSELEIDVLLGLDDLAHNRLYSMDLETGESTPALNWGRRNPDATCYCRLLKKLGVSRD